jgi:hypothetical protein
VSHPIPFHTVERLERALEASSRFVTARGRKGWVMRIVAYFACQYCEAVIELLEGLLAEYRAGTLVLPGMADDSSPIPDNCETGRRRTARPRARPAAARRVRSPHDDSVDDRRAIPADARQPGAAENAVVASRRVETPPSSSRPPIRRPAHGPGGRAFHPSAVPRWPIRESGLTTAPPKHAYFVTI